MRGRAVQRVRRAGELQRQGDVLQRGHGRDKMEILEYDAHMITAKHREGILVEAGETGPGDANGAAGGPLEAGDHHQHAGLAGSRGADDADRLRRADGQIDAAKNIDIAGGRSQLQVDIVEDDGGAVRFKTARRV